MSVQNLKNNKLAKKLKIYWTALRDFYSTQIHIGEKTLYSLHYRRIGSSVVGTMAIVVGISLFSIDKPMQKLGSWIGMTAEASTVRESRIQESKEKAIHNDISHRSAKSEEYEIALISSSTNDFSRNNFLRVTLVNDVDTGNERSPIIFRVIETFDKRIPEGAIALGALDDTKGDRVYGKVMAIKTDEDEGFEVEGEIMSVDGTSGMRGEINTNRDSALAGTAIGSFVAGAAAGLIHTTPFEIGGFRENLRNSLLSGTSETANKAAEIYTEDMKNKNATVHVKRGSDAVVLIRSF